MKDTIPDHVIRRACPGDLEAVGNLLRQVLKVHHGGRPDLFRPEGKKYSDEELLRIFDNPDTPVFVFDQGGEVLGYAFCALERLSGGSLNPMSSLYIDDICVDEKARRRHVGRSLFEHVKAFAREKGCYNITLHVWEFNHAAKRFYESLGMSPQFTSMELLCK